MKKKRKRKKRNNNNNNNNNNNKPATVTENQTATILWDMPIQTDKEIKANRPDMHSDERQEGKNLSAY